MLVLSIYQAKDGWRWRAKRGGRIVADGAECYVSKGNAKRSIIRFLDAIRWARFVVQYPK